VAAAWLAHLYTASGAVLAFLAMKAVVEYDYRRAFLWLAVQVIVDATDGVLARRARVNERIPWFSGSKLDDLVDYLTYVFIPAVIVWHAPLVPVEYATFVAGSVLLSSAYGFCRDDAKTADHFFTGFPSYWNIVVLYLMVAGWSPTVNMAVLLGLAVLVFVPIRYVYPSRTPILMVPTNVLGALWGVAVLTMLWKYPSVPPALLGLSFVFPVYYFALSLVLHVQRR
jgi:phosphatidylcholine synthase